MPGRKRVLDMMGEGDQQGLLESTAGDLSIEFKGGIQNNECMVRPEVKQAVIELVKAETRRLAECGERRVGGGAMGGAMNIERLLQDILMNTRQPSRSRSSPVG